MKSLTVDFLVKFLFSSRAGALIRTIAWLSMVGLCTGVASMILIMSVMNGFNRSIRNRKFSVEPHLVAHMNKMSFADMAVHPATTWLKTQKNAEFDMVESQDVVLRSADGFVQGAVAQGVSEKTLERFFGKYQGGSGKEKLLLAEQALVGGSLGDIMGLFEKDDVTLVTPESLLGPQGMAPSFETLSVAGFLRTDIESIDEHKLFYLRDKSLQRLSNTASLKRYLDIWIQDPENYAPTQKKLEGFGLKVESWKDRNANLFYSLKLEKFMVGILLGLSTLIASFSLVTVMTLLVTQKRRDIGILMALGFPSHDLKRLFVRVGVILAGLGIGSGVVIGVVLSFLVGRYSDGVLPSVYEETNIPTELHAMQISTIVVAAVIFALITTWMSVRKVSKLTPVEALRL